MWVRSVSAQMNCWCSEITRVQTQIYLSASPTLVLLTENTQAAREGLGRKGKILTVTNVGGRQKMSPFSPVSCLIFCKKDKREGWLERWEHLLRDLVTSAFIPLFTELLCSAPPSSLYQCFSKWGPHTNTSSILRTCQKCTFLGPQLRFTESETLGLGSRMHTEVWEPLLSNPVVRRAKVP